MGLCSVRGTARSRPAPLGILDIRSQTRLRGHGKDLPYTLLLFLERVSQMRLCNQSFILHKRETGLEKYSVLGPPCTDNGLNSLWKFSTVPCAKVPEAIYCVHRLALRPTSSRASPRASSSRDALRLVSPGGLLDRLTRALEAPKRWAPCSALLSRVRAVQAWRIHTWRTGMCSLVG